MDLFLANDMSSISGGASPTAQDSSPFGGPDLSPTHYLAYCRDQEDASEEHPDALFQQLVPAEYQAPPEHALQNSEVLKGLNRGPNETSEEIVNEAAGRELLPREVQARVVLPDQALLKHSGLTSGAASPLAEVSGWQSNLMFLGQPSEANAHPAEIGNVLMFHGAPKAMAKAQSPPATDPRAQLPKS